MYNSFLEQHISRFSSRRMIFGLAAAIPVLAIACNGGADDAPDRAQPTRTIAPAAVSATAVPPESPTPPATIPGPDNDDDSGLLAEIGPDERAFASALAGQGWETDFTRFAEGLDVGNIRSGGVPRDGIASIDDPRFAPVSDPPDYMRDEEPVIVLKLNGDIRGYPLGIMTFHEIINDVVGGEPVIVTFCPLCNTSLAFPRTLPDGTILDFGVSGFLQNSDLIMYDRQTDSLWQQITGTGLIGTHAGTQLEFLPVAVGSWADYSASFPDGQILLRPTGDERHSITEQPLARDYSRPPYPGYDDINSSPFLYDGPFDGRLLPMERVASVSTGEVDVAYPYSFLAEHPVINDVIEGMSVSVFFDNGTDSAFTARSGNFSRSGSTTMFERTVEGRVLTFELVEGVITDLETGSFWNKFGAATDGELVGTQLRPVTHAAHFWFAWAAFRPDTEVRLTDLPGAG
ncbi:MAG: DUF3179 domain-containing protein [Dehalococcoidia bacterium]|nr:DUF3179 domain-containing protein [Dehalococcoidia bacterium]